jgi:hypothetical protein
VAGPFLLETGPVNFSLSHNGSNLFVVQLYSASGELIARLSRGSDRFEVSRTLRVQSLRGALVPPIPGIHFLFIEADGDWTIEIA